MNISVIKLTPEEAERLRNKPYPGYAFNPIQDADGNWIISEAERDNPVFADERETLLQYPIIPFNPAISDPG